MRFNLISFLLLIILLSSCKSPVQNISYFQNVDHNPTIELKNVINYQTKIVPDDLLSITVSNIDPQSVAIFNLPLASFVEPDKSTTITNTPVIQTYLVDAQGFIDFPVFGKIEVSGKTCSELAESMKEQISGYAKSPIITIKIMNFKITVLGEVNIPGTKIIDNQRVSILDALGMAGDLTIYGERVNVLLIRDNSGKKEFYRYDLTSSEIFSSPYFYLQQNDVVYVEPNKARQGNAKYSQNAQFNVTVASTIIGAISVLASLGIALFLK